MYLFSFFSPSNSLTFSLLTGTVGLQIWPGPGKKQKTKKQNEKQQKKKKINTKKHTKNIKNIKKSKHPGFRAQAF
jgi:flagellar biosynthesis component FlhA